ncbi:MAG: RNA polymerase sigma factor [Polyangia bacterium]
MTAGVAAGVEIDPRVAAAQAGDRKAAADLLAQLLPRLRNLIRYLVRGDQHVDDIAQEALIAILRGLPTYRGDGSLGSWADRIVARTAIGWVRRQRKLREREQESFDPQALQTRSEPPDAYTLRRQAVARLDVLPYDQRHALVLHHVVGLSVPEIAAQLEAPLETIRSRLRIAHNKLRELAGGEPGPSEVQS